jgi:hypothetical protein
MFQLCGFSGLVSYLLRKDAWQRLRKKYPTLRPRVLLTRYVTAVHGGVDPATVDLAAFPVSPFKPSGQGRVRKRARQKQFQAGRKIVRGLDRGEITLATVYDTYRELASKE